MPGKNILQFVTKTINAVLVGDAKAMHILQTEFLDTVILIEIEDFNLTGYVVVTSHGLVLQKTTKKPVNFSIQGRLMALLGMSPLGHNSAPGAWPKAISIKGDVAQAEKFRSWLFRLELDWGLILKPYLGDFLATGLVSGISSGFDLLHSGIDKLQTHSKNWLADEVELVVSKFELEQFFAEVDMIRQDADRILIKANKFLQEE